MNYFPDIAELLQSIAETLISVDAAKDEILFNEGDVANGLYIVAKGEIVTKKQPDIMLKTYKTADFFGELALLDGNPRRATAIATEESLLYRLSRSEFERITDDVPEILKVIVKTVLSYLPH